MTQLRERKTRKAEKLSCRDKGARRQKTRRVKKNMKKLCEFNILPGLSHFEI